MSQQADQRTDERCPLFHDWFHDLDAIAPAAGGAWGVLICSNGALQVRWRCPECDRLSTTSMGHHRASTDFGLDVRQLPVFHDNRPTGVR